MFRLDAPTFQAYLLHLCCPPHRWSERVQDVEGYERANGIYSRSATPGEARDRDRSWEHRWRALWFQAVAKRLRAGHRVQLSEDEVQKLQAQAITQASQAERQGKSTE